MLCAIGCLIFFLVNNQPSVLRYEKEIYQGNIYQADLPVDSLCVTTEDIKYDLFQTKDEFHAVSLLKLDEAEVIHAENIHERIYPASTTKLMTVYLALKYGSLEDEVVITAKAQDIPLDSSRAGLRVGDRMTLLDLLYGLMLPSGNDAAIAVAEHISGSVEDFVVLMNQEAKKIGASNSNFVNPHGYQDENHYTTAYDLYLIFNACLKFPEFETIVSADSYSLQITQHNGTYRNEQWLQSNWFINGNASAPNGITIIGGKTGTTDEAGSCLMMLFKDETDTPYIAVIMGAENRSVLYKNMDTLLSTTLQ